MRLFNLFLIILNITIKALNIIKYKNKLWF